MGTKGRSQRHREEANQGKRPQKNSSLSTPWSDFQPPKLWGKDFLLFTPPSLWHSIAKMDLEAFVLWACGCPPSLFLLPFSYLDCYVSNAWCVESLIKSFFLCGGGGTENAPGRHI
jgi:hypothetical protein